MSYSSAVKRLYPYTNPTKTNRKFLKFGHTSLHRCPLRLEHMAQHHTFLFAEHPPFARWLVELIPCLRCHNERQGCELLHDLMLRSRRRSAVLGRSGALYSEGEKQSSKAGISPTPPNSMRGIVPKKPAINDLELRCIFLFRDESMLSFSTYSWSID